MFLRHAKLQKDIDGSISWCIIFVLWPLVNNFRKLLIQGFYAFGIAHLNEFSVLDRKINNGCHQLKVR